MSTPHSPPQCPRKRTPSPPPQYNPPAPSLLSTLLKHISTLLLLPLRSLHTILPSFLLPPSTPQLPLSHYTALLKTPSTYPITPEELDKHLHIHILASGRKLGYTVFGSTEPSAKTIFRMPGFPGSAVEGASCDAFLRGLGVRLVVVDRPGYGWSEAVGEEEERRWEAEMGGCEGARLRGIARDVEELAEGLGVQRFGVLGVSGGGAATLSCAYHIAAPKLQVATLICAMGPPDIGMRGAALTHRLGWPYMRWSPAFLLKRFFQSDVLAQPHLSDAARLKELLNPNHLNKMHKKDLEVLGDVDNARLMNATARHTYWQGFDGMVRDAKVSCSPFGFRIEDTRRDLPVRLWYGTLDVFVPRVQGETMAKRLGGREEGLVRLELLEETHASIFFKRREEALRDMVECMERADEMEKRASEV